MNPTDPNTNNTNGLKPITLDQIQQNPFLNAMFAPYLSPGIGLQQQQAELPGEQAQSASDIANLQTAQQKAKQVQFQNSTQQLFDNATKNGGYVDPKIYNQQKDQAAGIGITADQFDTLYEHDYTDPTSIQYNTGAGYANRNALGEVQRQLGALIDRYNSIPEAQKGLFSTSATSQIPYLGDVLAPQAKEYENAVSGLAAQLKELAGGGQGTGLRVTQTELNRWGNLLPSPRKTDQENAYDLQTLDAEIKSAFNSPTGLNPKYLPNTQQAQMTPAQIQAMGAQKAPIPPIVQNAVNNIKGDITAPITAATTPFSSLQQFLQTKNPAYITQAVNSANPTQILGNMALGYGKNLYQDIGQPLNEVMQNQPFNPALVASRAQQNFVNRPVNTALDALPFLKFAGDMIPQDTTPPSENVPPTNTGATTGGASTNASPTMPQGNPIMDFLNPQGVIKRGGNYRNAVVDAATQAGKTISGDDIVSDIRDWATTAKQGNLGQGPYIDQAVTDAEQSYGGRKLTPQQAAQAYAEADSGFTKTGAPKTPIQSNIDRGLRDVLGNRLQQVAPGWDEATSTMAKGYQGQRSGPRKMVGRVANLGLGLAGLDEIRKILGINF